MDIQEATVFVVDDDKAVLESLTWLIESDGLNVKTFSQAQQLLDSDCLDKPGCLLLDIRMPGMSGLELQEKLNTLYCHLPIIFISGHANVQMAVRAMKVGAMDFLVKPIRDQELLESLHRAIRIDHSNRSQRAQHTEIRLKINKLTPREKQVMDKVITGKLNKITSAELGIGLKTVEIHRARIMRKMAAKNVADLVKMVMTYQQL